MDKGQLDQLLDTVHQHLSLNACSQWKLFDPTTVFYAKLETGEDADLEYVSHSICEHLGIVSAPLISYELNLRMQAHTAGEIRYVPGHRSQIRIPLSAIGKPHPLGAILAHELTHEFLFQRAAFWANGEHHEEITDLASIALGLGKLVLNGMTGPSGFGAPEIEVLGYISPESKVYAYQRIIAIHSVPDSESRINLTADVDTLFQ